MTEQIEIIHSKRKTVAIQIKSNGRIVVRAPLRMSKTDITRLVEEKSGWIEKHLAQLRRQSDSAEPAFTAGQLRQLAEAARQDFPRRAARFAPLVGVSYGRITIRAQKSRWGSCSSKGNLNFNCLLMLCPEEVRDYVVVHELCHRKEMNHSDRFWQELARVFPDYEKPRKWLKTNGSALIRRLP
ncbi:MAG: M48 family metallopeptidase [Candidatus Limivicinus sp.]